MQNVLKTHQVTASFFSHAGHGQLHIRPFLDLSNPADVRKMQQLAADMYAEVVKVGGTISGEHGDGLSRTWFVRQQYGPLYDVFREVKRIFELAPEISSVTKLARRMYTSRRTLGRHFALSGVPVPSPGPGK